MEEQKLPEYFRDYFWDVKFEELDATTNPAFIIKRVLDRGDTQAIRWLKSTYTDEQIKEVLLRTRDLSRPTGNFWADVLGLDKTKMPCLTKPYSPIHFGLYS